MNIKKRLKSFLKFALPLLLGFGLLWYLYRDMDFEQVLKELSGNVSYTWLAFSLIFGLLANTLRGLRWHLLVKPIAEENGAEPKRSNAICCVLGSYTVNMVIPRGGEFWRCIEYRKREDISFTKLFGTLINDRLADVFSLGVLLLGVIIWQFRFFKELLIDNPYLMLKMEGLLASEWFYLLCLGLLISLGGLGYFVWRYPNNRLSNIMRSIWDGMLSITQIEKKLAFIIYSIAIWLGYFLFFYTSFFAFSFTASLPISVACIAFVLSSMSVIFPVQAGIGAWHAMVILALTKFGVSYDNAGIFAFIVFFVQTAWITLNGVVGIMALPFINNDYKRKLY